MANLMDYLAETEFLSLGDLVRCPLCRGALHCFRGSWQCHCSPTPSGDPGPRNSQDRYAGLAQQIGQDRRRLHSSIRPNDKDGTHKEGFKDLSTE
jgi:hypothetical protein